MIRILLITLILFMAMPAMAITHPDERLNDPTLEARAVSLNQELRCVVCQNESIEESRADMARDLRVLVRQQIKEGRTDDQIRLFLSEKYGDFIFLKPPVANRTYILWAMPVIILLAGGFMMLLSLRGRRRRV